MGDCMKIIDLHCDTIWKIYAKENYSFFENNGHITEKGLLDGGYIAQCFAIYTSVKYKGEEAYLYFEDRFSDAQKLFSECNHIDIATTHSQILENTKNNKVSAILTVENGEYLNGKIERLDETDKRGFKIFGLIHNAENCIGYYHAGEGDNAGLKPFGKEVVDAVNSTNMVVDVSHLNCGGFWDVVKLSKKPVIATHSACRNIKDHTRNLYDDQIKAIARSGGIVGVPFYDLFLKEGNKTETADIIRHIEHLIKIGGEDIVAVGTDFDGIDNELFIENCSGMQQLTNEIEKHFGYNLAEKICYKNALRIL